MPALDAVCEIVKAAGAIARGHFQNAPEYWQKDNDQGRVSVADLEVDAYLNDALHALLPQSAILSEEQEDDLSRLDHERVWIIDPIDGTEAFLKNEPYYAVSVALVENERPVLGVIYLPSLDQIYCAKQGEGAFFQNEPIQASGASELSQARFLASRAKYNQAAIAPDPPLAIEFRPSIAYRLALVAQGVYDGAFALRPTWEWDVAAAVILLEEAGAVLADRDGNSAKFNQKNPQVNGMIAGSEKLVHDMRERIASTHR